MNSVKIRLNTAYPALKETHICCPPLQGISLSLLADKCGTKLISQNVKNSVSVKYAPEVR